VLNRRLQGQKVEQRNQYWFCPTGATRMSEQNQVWVNSCKNLRNDLLREEPTSPKPLELQGQSIDPQSSWVWGWRHKQNTLCCVLTHTGLSQASTPLLKQELGSPLVKRPLWRKRLAPPEKLICDNIQLPWEILDPYKPLVPQHQKEEGGYPLHQTPRKRSFLKVKVSPYWGTVCRNHN